jgi:ribonuclease D
LRHGADAVDCRERFYFDGDIQMTNGWVWIDTPSKIDEAREDISRSAIICVDTEYDSFRYFRAMLCLLQIEADENTYLFDPLNGMDYSFLGQVFADPNILKVMHAGDNDVRILKRDYGFAFSNIFDTHRAASLLGCHYLSLAALVGRYLGIEFEKKKAMQRSRWDIRPLSWEQLQYAVKDTAYLKKLYRRLEEEIGEKGLKANAAKAFEGIADVTWGENHFDPRGYKNMKGYQSLDGHQKRCLKHLYHWRFQKADETNLALFRILSDQTLFDLVRMETPSVEMLTYSGVLSYEMASRYGSEIVQILNRRDEK